MDDVVSATPVVMADIITLATVADGSVAVVTSTFQTEACCHCILFRRSTILQ